jgi:hypothetical protein
MKRIFATLCISILLFASIVTAQTFVSIASIQDTTGTGSQASPMVGQLVKISGIVTAEHRGSVAANGGISDHYFFMQDADAPWSGINVEYSTQLLAEGDSVTVTGTVEESSDQTRINNVTSLVVEKSDCQLPAPLIVSTAAAATEAYEGCLIQVRNVTITETNIGTYLNWKVSDGSGDLKIDTRAQYYYIPIASETVTSLTGIGLYSSGEYTLAPRLAADIIEGDGITRIQRIQQVRTSDLLKAPQDSHSDISYIYGDTVSIEGVVTVPTGLSYAGAGIKFVVEEPEGGPWSGILSYNPDSTAYPVLYEGDLIRMTGYIYEYATGPSNMTEYFITAPIQILDFGRPLPPVDTVKTGDMRIPETAEQWGNVMVALKDAVVSNNQPPSEPYGMFAVDDGTGQVWIDHDSDSLLQWYNAGNILPKGTVFNSIRGWAYHHYGDYADSSTYKLVPSYLSDLVIGSAPPQLKNPKRDPGVPQSTDPVVASLNVTTSGTINSAKIYFSVNEGNYQTITMMETPGGIWTGTIPAQANGSRVDYYYEFIDDIGQKSVMPVNLAQINYSYVIRDEGLSIADIQYTNWPLADSPFNGYQVEVTGIVTADTSTKLRYGAYAIQDASGPWNGIFLFGIDDILVLGDEVQAWGTVSDYNPDYHYKWDNNTVILVDSFKVLSSDNALPEIPVVPFASLGNNTAVAESYEGTLVRVNNAPITAINPYDFTVGDRTGTCLVDADGIAPGGRDQDPNPFVYINAAHGYVVAWGDTLRVGYTFSFIKGFFTYSFGTFKIELRGKTDIDRPSGIYTEPAVQPLTYALHQNYPNPFNPETRIYFEIPQVEEVKIIIYNVLGQKIRSLASGRFNPGQHVLNWDGKNDFGDLVSSGTYIVRMKAGDFIDSRKMLLIR